MDIKHLLIAIAPDQQTGDEISLVLSLAEAKRLQVTFVSVVAELPDLPAMDDDPTSAEQVLETVLNSRQDKLNELIAQQSKHYPNIDFHSAVVAGISYVKIIELANQLQADMIVINANDGGKRYASQFGSTTRHLMRKSNVPVWTTPRNNVSALKSIVAAVDVSDHHEEGQAFNRAIVNRALQISRLSGAPLSIVYAWRNYAKTYLGGWNNGNKLTSAIWVHEQKEKHQQNLEALISELQESGDQISIELVEGPPEQALPPFINSKSADLLVIGTICRTGIAGMFIGNTAESVLDAVDCSVLTLKPEGFVSPVLERS